MWAKVLPSISQVVSEAQLEVNELVDMKWKFGVTAACNELRRVGSTFLQVRFMFIIFTIFQSSIGD